MLKKTCVLFGVLALVQIQGKIKIMLPIINEGSLNTPIELLPIKAQLTHLPFGKVIKLTN